ncbi:DNA polymerase Y family protein [Lysinimonas soli]|uniref:DNA polymerase Y family protein n=1 Tax=Lysinimonas soli TaxID=1074233 RepID=A0ABW0NRT3_9MICO
MDAIGAVPPRLLVLWAPDWPVLAHARALRLSEDAPVALVDKGLVFACSASARAEGVVRGQRIREAQALCVRLHVLRYDPALDARAFEPVLAGLEQALPGLHPLRPGTLAVRARGPARYYGGEPAAALTVLGSVAEFGVERARVGIADGLFAAERAARARSASPDQETRPTVSPNQDGGRRVQPGILNQRQEHRVTIVPPGSTATAAFLAPLPITLLEQPELVGLLPRLGIRTLGEFAALDAYDVVTRFGPLGARLHALAGGRDPRPATPRQPPRDAEVVVDFEPPLDRVDQLAFGVRSASDDFVTALLSQRLVCTALRIELFGDRGEVSERVWLHPRSFTAAEVVDRIRWQLSGALQPGAESSSGRLVSPVTRVRLSPETVDPVGAHERGLWGGGPDENVHSGLSRVQGMVGHRGVLTATASGGRTPAERQALVPWGDRPLVARDPKKPWPGALPPPAPATVYELPRPIAVQDARGRPVAVDERGELSAAPAAIVSSGTGARARRTITAWAGPWPLEQRWWDAAAARSMQRFQAVDGEGVAWLLVLDHEGWWAEGRYD